MTVLGLVDTGADRSVLPLGLASLLGHPTETLSPGEAMQVHGRVTTWRAASAIRAVVRSVPELPFDLDPVFIGGMLHALWGRADFLRAWDVLVSETAGRFELRLPTAG